MQELKNFSICYWVQHKKILQNNIHFQVPNCLVELSVKEVKDGYLNSVSKEKTFKAHKGHKK